MANPSVLQLLSHQRRSPPCGEPQIKMAPDPPSGAGGAVSARPRFLLFVSDLWMPRLNPHPVPLDGTPNNFSPRKRASPLSSPIAPSGQGEYSGFFWALSIVFRATSKFGLVRNINLSKEEAFEKHYKDLKRRLLADINV